MTPLQFIVESFENNVLVPTREFYQRARLIGLGVVCAVIAALAVIAPHLSATAHRRVDNINVGFALLTVGYWLYCKRRVARMCADAERLIQSEAARLQNFIDPWFESTSGVIVDAISRRYCFGTALGEKRLYLAVDEGRAILHRFSIGAVSRELRHAANKFAASHLLQSRHSKP